ncbi:MAG: hypothetical protein QM770_09410 [Tepidisphaeraceae bacterium]
MSSSIASAQTGPGLLLKPFDENKGYELSASTAYFFDAGAKDVSGEPDIQVTTVRAQGRMKLDFEDINSTIHKAQPRAGFDVKHLILNRDNTAFLPGQFTDASIGAGMGIAAGDKWKAGVTFGIGYAGAGAFGDGDGIYGKADLAVGIDLDDRSSLGIVLNYDGNRSFLPDVPLPGFLYTYRISNELSLGVGVPFSNIVWTPSDKWRVELTYAFPDVATAKVEYKLTDHLGLYAELANETYSFHWDGLQQGRDRVFFTQNRIELGVSGYAAKDVRLTVAGGYAFGQTFEQGWDTRDSDTITDLDSAPYARVELSARF